MGLHLLPSLAMVGMMIWLAALTWAPSVLRNKPEQIPHFE